MQSAFFKNTSIVLNLAHNKNKSRDMIHDIRYDIDPERCSNLIFLEKGLGIVPSAQFLHDFSRKMLIKIYSIN